jgi:hypothetical protein
LPLHNRFCRLKKNVASRLGSCVRRSIASPVTGDYLRELA